MKFIYSFLFLFSLLSNSQKENDKVIYTDSLGIEVAEGNHKYYKIIEDYYVVKPMYKVSEYYASGKIKESGLSSKKEYFIKEGEVYSYFENDKIESIINYTENIKNGKCIYWYENGSKKLEGNSNVVQDKKGYKSIFEVQNFWDQKNNQTVINGQGEMTDSGEFDFFGLKCISNGKIKNGIKDGEWKGEILNPYFTFTEFYENGKLISGTSIDYEKNIYKYTEINILPESKGGLEQFYKYVMNNFKLPENFFNGGTILTGFVIEKDGSIVELKTEKSLRKDLDEEAIRLISNYKDFSPALLRGIKVRCHFRIPITLQDGE